MGLTLIREQARQPYNAGIGVDWEDKSALTIGVVHPNSPAEDAGLQEGDEIISIAKKNVSRENFLVALSKFKQGDRVSVTVKRDRQTIQATLLLGPAERFEYRIEERKDATTQQKALRSAWLNGA
jgi:predicted metalloprotease with PDZ domain